MLKKPNNNIDFWLFWTKNSLQKAGTESNLTHLWNLVFAELLLLFHLTAATYRCTTWTGDTAVGSGGLQLQQSNHTHQRSE